MSRKKTLLEEDKCPAKRRETGCWINLFDPTVAEIVGRVGYDAALVDLEHSTATLDKALPMVRALQAAGCRALVRIPDRQPEWVSRIMDMGADGVMVPMVSCPHEARQLALMAQYAPLGTRGMAAGLVRGSYYGLGAPDYVDTCRASFELIVQIETRQAVEQVNLIAEVPGIDTLFIGPFDLSGSLGNRASPDHRDTRRAMKTIVQAAKAQNKRVATLTTPARNARKFFSEGYDLVFSGSDIGLLRDALLADSEKSRHARSQGS